MNEQSPEASNGIRAWQAGHSVGNALLDKQHIVIIGLIRSLWQTHAVLDEHAFMRALSDIVTLAERHCAAEEHLLALNGYEWLEQHREEHLAGLDRIRSICEQRARGDISRERACAAVATWFEAHVSEMDLPARDYLRSSAGPLAGDKAPEPLEVDSARESV